MRSRRMNARREEVRRRSKEIFGDARFGFAALLLVVVDLPRYPYMHGVPFSGFLREINLTLRYRCDKDDVICG